MKILLVQTSYLGDTILSTPVIAGLKAIYPAARLWMLTALQASDLVKRDPFLAGVFTYDKRKTDRGAVGFLRMCRRISAMGFDIAYSLHRSYRTALMLRFCRIPITIGFKDAKWSFLYSRTRRRNPGDHDVVRNLSLLAGDAPAETLDSELRLFAPLGHEIKNEIRERLQDLGRYAVLAPGSAWATKRWPWPCYREVARYLLDRDLAVVVVGAPSESAVCEKVARDLPLVNLAGKTTIGEVMFTVKNAALVVCNDSMTLHLASAFKVPNVAIFCATSPEFGFGPWRNRAVVVQREDLPCKPCARHGGQRCPTGTEACMQGLSPEVVVGAIERLLQ